ncbi:MAG: cyclic nucleotide-binding domain-containing protein [Caldilineaceae bacterium]|nr:cyclic nucleotide-binding domain-containing protein [Caldilineaceae bacterium]
MLSTAEKIRVLRAAPLFVATPEAILAEVAALLEEVEVDAGQTIFEEGQYGNAMYIIASGRVRVHRGGRTLAYVEKYNVFGEMSLLDPEPRSASVTAEEQTALLRLARAPFYELMAHRNEVAFGVIQMLCQYQRARLTEMVDDYHYIQQVAQLTAAAAAVEAGVYEPESIASVTERADPLGQLARVFQRMIREVYAREQRLQRQVQELRIEVDHARQARQVSQITGTDYFRQLRGKAGDLRKLLKGEEEEGSPD